MTAAAKFPIAKLVVGVGVLTIGGAEYACTRYYSMFQLNAIPFCKAIILPEEGSTFVDLYDKLNEHTVGEEVTLTFKFSGQFINEPSRSSSVVMDAEAVTVFKGRYIGWSPSLAGTLMQVSVWALHPLCTLDWSSSVVDEIHGRSLGDSALKMTAAVNESIVPFMQEPYDSDVTDDIWENLIKAEMLKLVQYKRFGAVNSAALDFLNNYDLSSDELPLSLTTENARRIIIDIRRTLYSSTDGTTLWDKLVQLAGKYYFAVSPRIDGASIIPFSALLGIKPSILRYNEFTTENNFIPYLTRLFSSIETIEGIESYSLPFDVVGRESKPAELRQVLDEDTHAAGVYCSAPWAQIGNDLSYLAKASIGIDGSIRAVGYAIAPGEAKSDSITPNKLYNDGGSDSEKFAKAALNDVLFKQRTAYLQSTLRFDLAPGSLVCIGRARDPEVNPAFYGTVHSVCNAVMAEAGPSGTWIILSNVRNVKEQDGINEYTEHPLYGNTWISAPLVAIENHTPGKNIGG